MMGCPSVAETTAVLFFLHAVGGSTAPGAELVFMDPDGGNSAVPILGGTVLGRRFALRFGTGARSKIESIDAVTVQNSPSKWRDVQLCSNQDVECQDLFVAFAIQWRARHVTTAPQAEVSAPLELNCIDSSCPGGTEPVYATFGRSIEQNGHETSGAYNEAVHVGAADFEGSTFLGGRDGREHYSVTTNGERQDAISSGSTACELDTYTEVLNVAVGTAGQLNVPQQSAVDMRLRAESDARHTATFSTDKEQDGKGSTAKTFVCGGPENALSCPLFGLVALTIIKIELISFYSDTRRKVKSFARRLIASRGESCDRSALK